MTERPPWTFYLSRLFFVIGLMLLGSLVFSLIGFGIGTLIYPALTFDELQATDQLFNNYPHLLYLFLALNSIGMFAAPALIMPFIDDWNFWEYMRVDPDMPGLLLLLLMPLLLFIFGPVGLAASLNDLVPFERIGWLKELEDSTSAQYLQLLQADNWLQLLLLLVVAAIIPAICEELFFRGIGIRLFESWTKSGHAAVWITALIFTIMHLQPSGVLPRLVLGLYLGYLFLWTRNIWFPIIAHFVNNAIAVIAFNLYSPEKAESMDVASGVWEWIIMIGATAIFLVFLILFKDHANTLIGEDAEREIPDSTSESMGSDILDQ